MRKPCPDMIKVQNDNGFKYIPERDVEAMHEFITNPSLIDDGEWFLIRDAMTVIRKYLVSQDIPNGRLWYSSEDGKVQEPVFYVDLKITDEVIALVDRMI